MSRYKAIDNSHSILRIQIYAMGLLALLLAGCSSAEVAPRPEEKQYSFPDAPGVVYLTALGSQNDINPPSAFRQWLLGKDAFVGEDGINKPYGIAVGEGRIYINDGRQNAGFWVYDLEKNELRLIRNQLLSGGLGIAVDDRNHKYLTVPLLLKSKQLGTLGTKDEKGRIVVFDEKEEQIKVMDFPGRPIEIAVYGERLYVTDGANHRVVVLDRNTLEVVKTIGKQGNGDSEFNFPKSIAAGEDGRIYVGDLFNGKIKVFDKDGAFLSQYGYRTRLLGGFINPTGIDVDRESRLYAVDFGYAQKISRDEVQIFDTDKFYQAGEEVPPQDSTEEKKNALLGYFLRPFGLGTVGQAPVGTAGLYAPVDIAVDYKNVKYFKNYEKPGVRFIYLIWLTSQFAADGKNLSLFVYAAKN